MRLKESVSIESFILAIGKCQHDVLYCTDEGDQLNLKSALSRFIFLSTIEGAAILRNGHIVCSEADLPHLQSYIEI